VRDEGEHSVARVKMLENQKPNDLLAALIPNVEVLGFREIVPNMNDIFIRSVGAD
jgi:ABC-2 type transport system ATP-binding protein